jgi:hypothetical protein
MDLREQPEVVRRRHPWEVVRAEFFVRLLALMGQSNQSSWLDVGAGDAYLAGRLRNWVGPEPRIVCWDINYSPTARVHTPSALEFTHSAPAGRFGTILLLDVIEHVEDDRAFVGDIVDNFLAPDGRVIISVPAYMMLYTSHDSSLQHYRRYSPRQGRRLLREAGLSVLAEGGLFHSLLPIRAGQALVENRRQVPDTKVGVGAWKGGPLTSAWLERVLRADASASLFLGTRGVVVPGLSYWAVCRQPQGVRSDGAGTTPSESDAVVGIGSLKSSSLDAGREAG